MQLMLVRHARNDWVGKRLAGWTPGVHLNDEGRRKRTDKIIELLKQQGVTTAASPVL